MADKLADKVTSKLYYKDLMKEFKELSQTNPSQKDFMTKQWVDITIQRILAAQSIISMQASGYSTLHESVKTTLCTYLVDKSKDDKPILVLKPVPGKEHRSKTIIPLEETYEVVKEAHLLTKHGSVKEMETWLSNNNYLLSGICCAIYHKHCTKCFDCTLTPMQPEPNEEITLDKEQSKPVSPIPETSDTRLIIDEDSFESVCSIEVLDISNNSDHYYHFLLIYEDKKTDYIQLRPMNTNTETEMSVELLKLLMDFGPPDCLVVDIDNLKIFQKILKRLESLVYCDIVLAFQQSEKKLSQTVAGKIIAWMKDHDCKNWGTGCHEVQWNMNNEPDHEGITPFSKVFGNQYTGLGYKSKFMPLVNDNSDEDDGDAVTLQLLLGEEDDEEKDPNQEQSTNPSTEIEMTEEDGFLITLTENVTEVNEPAIILSGLNIN